MLSDSKVVLGYVHGGNLRNEFFVSVLEFLKYDSLNRRLWNGYIGMGGLYIDDNRNGVVKQFLKDKSGEWLWSVDTDIRFSPDALYKLLDVADPIKAPIVSALYFGNVGVSYTNGVIESGLKALWFSHRPEGQGYRIYPNFIRFGEMHDIDAIPMGFCVIHRSVLEHMAEAYKSDPWTWFAHDITTNASGELERMGEDLAFCERATRLGYKIHGLGLVVNHIKTLEVDLALFLDRNPTCAVQKPTSDGNGRLPHDIKSVEGSHVSGTSDRLRVHSR